MFRRTRFTTISPLPANITRQVVVDFLHDHQEMIDLNPLVKERHPISPPPHAPPEEMACVWYSLTDKISYLPGDLYTGDVTYTCAFNDLRNGVQTHCYAPAGLTIRDKWTLQGSLPDEPSEPIELGIGAPLTGLYIREDVDMRCNVLLTTFVKRTLKKSHAALIERLKTKAQIASDGVPLPQQTNVVASNGGNSKLDPNMLPVGGLSLTSSNSSGFMGRERATSSAAASASSVASGGGASWSTSSGGSAMMTVTQSVRRSPSPAAGTGLGINVSSQTMQYYEQQLQPRVPSPSFPQQPQLQIQRTESWQSPPHYASSPVPQWQPRQQMQCTNQQSQYANQQSQYVNQQLQYNADQQQPHYTAPQPQPQPQPQVTEPRLQYRQLPAPTERASSRGRVEQEQHRLVPSPLRVPSDYLRRDGQQLPDPYSGGNLDKVETLTSPPKLQVQGQADSPLGATLRGPFTLAELP